MIAAAPPAGDAGRATGSALAARLAADLDGGPDAKTLASRARDFEHALARGGSRDDYRRWEASRDALLAAFEILQHRARGKS